MALWNKVSAGFNADDETVNFGARTVAENNGSIYETSTLATIQSDGQVITNPKVSASIQYSMLCVAVDKSITIFNDESCHEIVLSIGFDSLITTYCMSRDCSFVLIALATGVVHCLHIPSGGRQVFYENVEEKFGDVVIKILLREEEDRTNVLFVANSGVIYSIKGFDLNAAHRALINEDEDALEKIVDNIDCTEIFKGSKTTQAACIDLGLSDQSSFVVTIGKDIHLWPSERRCGHLSALPYEYTKVQFFKNYGAMICLRSDGVLSVVCLETLLGRKLWNGPVADFVTVQDKINDPYQIVILTVPENGATTTTLRFHSFPDFESKFEISVPTTTYLVDLVGCSLENIVFLEGIAISGGKIETIRVKAIVESIPEYRLQRLLRREQFEEAEFFARQFQLSLEPVHAAKAAAFINQLGPWSSETNNAAKLETFVSTLDKIKDVRYIYDCCNNALTSNYKQTRRLLLYARQRITRHIEETNSQEFATLLSTLNATLRKLETFQIIQKTKITVEPPSSSSEDVEEWIRFSRANLLSECVKHLSLGELEAAAAIWIRHLPEMAPVITPSSISDILQSIPETTAPAKLWPWLCHFVPSVISLLPSGLPQIILWGYQKTKTLEKSCRTEWPQVGLDFARGLMDLLSFQESSVCLYFHQQYASKNSHLHRLMTLVQAMTDLLELKTHHRILIPLETYLGDPGNVIHLLLNKAHVEGIPNLIESFLQQYMLNNSLQNDQVFCTYVQKTLRNSKGWWFWEKAPWEQRVSIVIGYIHNVQNRLQQTLDVLKKAPVPWSETVIRLAEDSYTFDHPLVSKIRTESSGVAVKLILKKYGYAHVGLCTRLFRYIIKQDRSDMIDDICELTKADNSMRLKAFCLCTNHHLNNGNIDKAMEVLRHVDDDTARHCCEQIVSVTIAGLGLKTRDEWLSNYVEALGTVRDKLQQILSQKSGYAVEFNEAFRNIPHLKRIYKLDKQFNVRIDLTEYHTRKAEVFERYLDELASDVKHEKISVSASCDSVVKVSDLLELPALSSMLKFFEKTNDLAVLKRCVTRLARNGITSRDESSVVGKLCSAWITNADRDAETSMLLRSICSSNFVNCDKDQLADAVLSSNQSNAYIAALGYEGTCDSDSEQRIAAPSNYILYTTYKDAAVSSGQMLLPLYKDTLRLYSFFAEKSQAGRLENEDEDCDDEIRLLVKSLLDRTKRIQNEHYDYSLLQIMKNLHYGLSSLLFVNREVMMETRAVLAHCLYTLLRKVVSARSLDVSLGLSCLFMLTEQEASKWLATACRSFQGDLIRHRAVVELGYEYYRIIKHNEQLYTFDCQKLLHRWARRLTSYGISYKEVLTSDMQGKRSILERVMKSRKRDLLPLLKEFSVDFGFELNDCFLLYLQVLMSDWQPRLNFTMISGRKELKINENDVQELNARCKEVAAHINDKALMKRTLTQLSPQINFYHYEVFLAMLELLGEKNVERIEHFCFLQNYTRYGQPTEYEREEWAAICHENSSLPPISEWRLPFLPKIDQWKLITPELNLKTYEKWLSIAPTLKLQPHFICTLSIKGSVAEAWKSYSSNDRNRAADTWCLYPRNSSLLKEIKKCIACMSGPEGLHYGTASLYYVFNHTPQGADQVAAAQECYASARLWEQQSNASDEGMIEKIKDKYMRLTSKHILHTHGLGEERYLGLIGYPEKLVRELYNDESIPERCKGAIQRRPDINSAADALCQIFAMNMVKIRFDLLLDWLQPDAWEAKHNESITMGFGTSSTGVAVAEDNPVAEDNLLRACYILGSGDATLNANFLINIGFDKEKEDGYGPGVRFRALRVLQSITDELTLQDLTKRDLKSVREYMKSLRYLNELENLGLGYSVSGFESCSKHKLAQTLLKTQFCEPRALSLILQICLDFGVHDHSLLNATLERMAKQSMVRDLEKALPAVGTISHMVNSSGYIAGWQIVIANPFGKLDPRPTPKQVADCVGSLRLLHACPVVAKLEFRDVINRCFHCHQAHLAAALLPFLDDKDKDYVLQGIKESFKVTDVIADLTDLMPKGILVASQSLLMLRDIQEPGSVHKVETT